MLNWFSVASELHRDWRNDVKGLGNLLSNHLPAYRNLMTSYAAKGQAANLEPMQAPQRGLRPAKAE